MISKGCKSVLTTILGLAMVLPLLLSGCSSAPQKEGTTPEAPAPKPTVETKPDPKPEQNTKEIKKPNDHDQPIVKKHNELFVGWKKPLFALVASGRQHGYIEPCGCTGLAHQKGGLARRHTFLRQLAEKNWPVVSVDVGNQVRRFGPQAEIKFQFAAEGLKKMNYQAVGFGPDDLRLSVDELISITAASDDQPGPFVCANATVIDPEFTSRYRIIEAGGKKIGVTAILGKEHQAKIINRDITFKTADDGLKEVLPLMAEKKCDFYVLLAHTGIKESKRLAAKFPKFDVIITAGGAEEPAYEPEKLAGGKSILVQVGAKGMYLGVIGVFDDPKERLRFQRVPLDDRFADSKEMLDLLAAYQGVLKSKNLIGLNLKPLAHPSGSKFVGSKACDECHDGAYKIWKEGLDGKGGPHAHATESLIHPGERSNISRHFDPECLCCHVTGWNPQKIYPYISGYLGLEETPLMLHNGCENCHGPGSQHVAAEGDDSKLDEQAIEKLRATMRISLKAAEHKCMDCHDLDNSPDFHVKGAFEKYWKQIEH